MSKIRKVPRTAQPAPRYGFDLTRLRTLDLREPEVIEQEATVAEEEADPFFGIIAEKIPKPPRKYLSSSNFTNCCGINLIYGFPGTSTSGLGYRGCMKENDVREDLINHIGTSHTYGLSLIALNQDQVPLWGKLLEENKFYPLVEGFFHTGHSSNITLYGRVNHPKNKKELIPSEIGRRYRNGEAARSG